jgi:hypothetical protein
MKRGLLFFAWGDNSSLERAENAALDISARLRLPAAIASDLSFDAKDGLQYIKCDFSGFINQSSKRRKSLMAELTPFKQTLYLDSDVLLVDGSLQYAWRLLEQVGGLAMAIGKSGTGGNRFRESGLDVSVTYHNSGVIFFDKDKVADLFGEWKMLCQESKCRFSDEYLLNALLYKRNYPIASLPPSWNLRTNEPYDLAKNLKFWHSELPLPDVP